MLLQSMVYQSFKPPVENYVTHNPLSLASLRREKMAASSLKSDGNIPEYERTDINTKPFHVGSFRNEWLSRLKPDHYSFEEEDEATFEANFMKDLGVNAETMSELRSTCRYHQLISAITNTRKDKCCVLWPSYQ